MDRMEKIARKNEIKAAGNAVESLREDPVVRVERVIIRADEDGYRD
jgi:hypothetical protein